MSNSLITNFFWKFGEQSGAQLVGFVVSVVLARILSPVDYGAVAMVGVFVAIATVIVDGGFNSALIQKQNADDLDFNTVFYFSLFFSILTYLILFITAPLISSYYGEEYTILTPILRVLGLQVIIFSFNSIQQAYVARRMIFKNSFWATLAGTISSGIVGIFMAINGYGAWALVGQVMTAAIVNTLTLYAITRWTPSFMFSFKRLKSLLSYGYKLFVSGLLISLFQQIRALVIGKMYTPSDLAYYDRGRQYPNLIVANINTSIGAVLFPKLSQEQNDTTRLKESTRNSIRFSSYLMCPLMVGLAIVAEPLVRILLTEKWVPCVPLLRLFCVIYLFQPIHTANLQAIKALGRSDIFLKLEIIKRIIDLGALLLTMWISVKAIVIGMAIATSSFTIVNAHPNIKLLGYSLKEQLTDVLSPLIMSLVMILPHLITSMFLLSDWGVLILDVVFGAAIYLTLSHLTNNKEYKYLLVLCRTNIRRLFSKVE